MIITRFHNMAQLRLTVEFLTPTFLGGANQNAELRAAPFKNLLRQWWRVTKGSSCATHQEMLKQEGDLFGSVLDDSKASASQVRLTLTPNDGFNTLEEEFSFGDLRHPNVNGGRTPVSSALYLGYGPITFNRTSRTRTQSRRYIAPGSKASLTFTLPKTHEATLRDILAYIDAFGTIGSRCRNGYGSLALSGEGFLRQKAVAFSADKVAQETRSGGVVRRVKSATAFAADDIARIFSQGKQYPTTPGKDGKGLLCWESEPFQGWKPAMQALAETYLNIRTKTDIPPQGMGKRHILGYPITHHNLREWDGGAGRMPSQLRLMVKRNTANQLVARILHLPHKLPQTWNERALGTELSVWQDIHKRLDANTTFHRCGGAQ